MPPLIECPNCGQTLQVPDELLGKKVKCAKCGTTLQATPGPNALHVDPEDMRNQGHLGDEDWKDNPYGTPQTTPVSGFSRETAKQQVNTPAFCLLIYGILSVPLACFGALSTLSGNAQIDVVLKQQQQQMQQKGGRKLSPEEEKRMKELTEIVMKVAAGLSLVQIIPSVIIVVGAIQMMRLRSYALAMTSAILVMIPALTPCSCCLVGVPFGIFAILTLNKPGVAAAFQ